jgi:hypothetical protein
LLTVVLLGSLAVATRASAAVAPVFTRSAARAGERVGVVQRVQIGQPLHSRTAIVVYLIPLGRAPSGPFDGPPPRSLANHRLGELVGDSDGFWRLWFRVPGLRPGAYTTLVWCRPCSGTTYPHGSVFAGGLLASNGVLHIRR